MPVAYVQLECLPLTANGKLDRRALPVPEGEAYARKEYEAPQGEIEELLAGIWCELLHVERVGRHDNFFELGGHSLLVVQLLVRIRRELNVDISIGLIFSKPTVAAIAVEVFLEKLHQFESSDVERLLSKDAHLSSVEHNRLLHKE